MIDYIFYPHVDDHQMSSMLLSISQKGCKRFPGEITKTSKE